MNRKSCMLLIFFLVSLPLTGLASPVGNIGDPMLWNPGPFQEEGGLSIVPTVFYDSQVNHLPAQMTRFAWTNPDVVPAEHRHYQQVRRSRNTLVTYGVRMGIPVNDKALVYGVAGVANLTVDLHYEDWTISRVFASDDTFESGSSVLYGFGTSLVMHRGEFRKIPLTIGMDVSYRHYLIDEDRIKAEGLSYSSALDELQFAFCLSAEVKKISPYLGIKVASITGTEEYVNTNYATKYFKEGYIHYNEDITWSKNIGYYMGVTTSVMDMFSLGMEFRGGDENAMELSATTRF